MPIPIYQLNHPPHPFWDFVQELNERPNWGAAPHAESSRSQQPQQSSQQAEASRNVPADSTTKNEQNPADDPPEVDPSTLKGDNCKHQRRCARRCGREQREAHPEGGPQRGGWPHFGPPPFTMGGGPFGGPFGRGPRGPHGPHDHSGPHPPPPPFGFHGRGGHHHRGGHPFNHGGPRGHHHGRHSPQPPNPAFNLGEFLNNLGNRIGVDLTSAAEGLGIDRFMPSSTSPDVDFEPKVDIFDLAETYVIHASLPGARKEDVGVDWDGEHSVLRLAGVVHRPEADEVMLQHLAVDGRKREVGVFEKAIKLGTAKEPASIDVSGIKAKMTDGVLVVRVPKVEKEHHKRDVPISSATPSPPRYEHGFDPEDHEMYDAAPEGVQYNHPVLQPERPAAPPSRTVSVEPSLPTRPSKIGIVSEKVPEKHIDLTEESVQKEPSSKEVEAKQEKQNQQVEESLPTYEAKPQAYDNDWDESASDEEGEYVKINVD